MITEDQLSICKKCKLQSWEFTKGTICSLTNDYPKFYDSCATFELDAKRAEEYERLKVANEQADLEEKTFGLNSIGIKSQTNAGLIATAVGVLLTAGTVWFIGIMSIWTLGIILTGVIFVGRGIKEKPSVIPGLITAFLGLLLTGLVIYAFGILSLWGVALVLVGLIFTGLGIVNKVGKSKDQSLDEDL